MSEQDAPKIDSDVLKEIHEYGINLYSDIIYLEAPIECEDIESVSWAMARRFQKNMRALLDESPELVTIDINCPGGDAYQALAIYDTIKMCDRPTLGIVTGEASSAACIILQACDKRLVAPHALVMWHPGSSHIATAGSEVKSYFNFEQKTGDRLDRIVYNKMLKKRPDLKWEEFEIMVMKGIYLDAEEAIAMGLADGLLEYPKKA